MNRPASVEEIDPSNLEKAFGSGVTLRRILVQMTDDDISTGIAKRLPWLVSYRKRSMRLNGSTSVAIMTNDLADNLGPGAFSTELPH